MSLYLVPKSVNSFLALTALVLSPIFCWTHCSASAWYWASRIALFSSNLFYCSGTLEFLACWHSAPLVLVSCVHGYDTVTGYDVGPEHGLVCHEPVHRGLGLPGEWFQWFDPFSASSTSPSSRSACRPCLWSAMLVPMLDLPPV